MQPFMTYSREKAVTATKTDLPALINVMDHCRGLQAELKDDKPWQPAASNSSNTLLDEVLQPCRAARNLVMHNGPFELDSEDDVQAAIKPLLSLLHTLPEVGDCQRQQAVATLRRMMAPTAPAGARIATESVAAWRQLPQFRIQIVPPPRAGAAAPPTGGAGLGAGAGAGAGGLDDNELVYPHHGEHEWWVQDGALLDDVIRRACDDYYDNEPST